MNGIFGIALIGLLAISYVACDINCDELKTAFESMGKACGTETDKIQKKACFEKQIESNSACDSLRTECSGSNDVRKCWQDKIQEKCPDLGKSMKKAPSA